MRKARPAIEGEFLSVKLAFFHRISAWADALEQRDLDAARLELRHLDVLAERVLQDDLFIKAAAEQNLCPKDLVSCLSAYLGAITDSMRHTATSGEGSIEPDEERLDLI